MSRLRLLAFLPLLALAACDSSEPPATLTGTWNAEQSTLTYDVTVTSPQNALLPTEPGAGGVVLSGALSGTLRYHIFIGSIRYIADGPLFFSTTTPPTVALRISSSGAIELLRVSGGSISTTYTLAGHAGATPYTLTADGITLNTARFASGSSEIVATGALTFARRALAPGAPRRLVEFTETAAAMDPIRRTFTADGSYQQTNSDLTTSTGTWAEIGTDVLRIVVGDGSPTDFTRALTSGTLTLTRPQPCTGECLSELSVLFGLDPAAVSALAAATRASYRRSAAS